jgi:hypothetical protein
VPAPTFNCSISKSCASNSPTSTGNALLVIYSRLVGNPSVTRPNGQRRVRCGLPVIQKLCAFRLGILGE